MEKITGFILYFDILGYRNLIRKAEDEILLKNAIEEYSNFKAELWFSLVLGSFFEKDKLFYRFFSDNFFFLYESEFNKEEILFNICSVATMIQRAFLELGILTRGSISFGSVDYTDKVIFGNGLVHAVELEENHNEPSVRIDKELIPLFEKGNYKYREEVSLFDYWPDSVQDYNRCLEGLYRCVDRLNSQEVNKSVIKKIDWVIKKFNEYFGNDQMCEYALFSTANHFLLKDVRH